MLTSSHLYWTWRLRPATADRPQWLVGSVLPDAPALVIGSALMLGGASRWHVVDRTYAGPLRRSIHLAAHSLLATCAIAAAGPRTRALVLGTMGHQVVDYLTHVDDAWPPAWPLSSWRWRAPVSYWQREHHARAFAAMECAGLVAAVVTDRSQSRRVAGLGALALAMGPLVRESSYESAIGGGIDWEQYSEG